MRKWFIKLVGRLNRWLDEVLQNENDRNFRKELKILRTRINHAKKQEQQQCPHVAGCNIASETQDQLGRTSIVWHRTDLGIDVGICNNCHRLFQPSDPDYMEWRKKNSFNSMSAAGYRTFHTPPNFEYTTSDSIGETVSLPIKVVYSTGLDPWLADRKGNPDELALSRVDFRMADRDEEQLSEVANG
jgi:hypothetical protein